MTWFKVDDAFHSHPKVLAAGAAPLGLWVVAGSWCGANLTGGFVPDFVLPRLVDNAVEYAEVLVHTGLWIKVEGGHQFHDWSEFQPDAEAEKEKRRKRAESGRKGGLASGVARSKRATNREANGEAIASGVASGLVEPRPGPARPDLREGGARPRCPRHSHIPDSDPGPPCLACKEVRLAAEKVGVPQKPEWCGECDEHTRMVELADGRPSRCRACHPLRSVS